jgi:hypothetical protein
VPTVPPFPAASNLAPSPRLTVAPAFSNINHRPRSTFVRKCQFNRCRCPNFSLSCARMPV